MFREDRDAFSRLASCGCAVREGVERWTGACSRFGCLERRRPRESQEVLATRAIRSWQREREEREEGRKGRKGKKGRKGRGVE